MTNSVRKLAVLAAALLAAEALAGCGSLSRDVAPDGSHAGKLVWPLPSNVNPLHTGGSFPNLDNLRNVQAGLDKNQIIALIGPPQFDEGLAGVRDWDYLFNFRGKGGKVTQCEYKILFDRDMLARSFYWNPTACADILNPPTPRPAAAKTESKTFTLSADALFAFDKSDIHDITRKGVAELDDLAKQLTAPDMHADEIEVIGYTDRLGSDAYNQKLSARRADAVRDYLTGKGVPADHITAEGRGKADPVKTCDDRNRAQLIACLAPNRRVVVKAEGKH